MPRSSRGVSASITSLRGKAVAMTSEPRAAGAPPPPAAATWLHTNACTVEAGSVRRNRRVARLRRSVGVWTQVGRALGRTGHAEVWTSVARSWI